MLLGGQDMPSLMSWLPNIFLKVSYALAEVKHLGTVHCSDSGRRAAELMPLLYRHATGQGERLREGFHR